MARFSMCTIANGCFIVLWIRFTHGDVVSIEMVDVGNDYGLDEEQAKQITFKLDNNEDHEVIVKKRKSIFSDSLKVSDCLGDDCQDTELSENEKEELNKCNYKGKLKDDPDSNVQVSGCKEKDIMDISVISDKAKLKYNTYRADKDGLVNLSRNETIEVEKPHEGQDYGAIDDYKKNNHPSYFNVKDGMTYSIKYVERGKKKAENVDDMCCRATRQKCDESSNNRKKCTIARGKVLCGRECITLVAKIKILAQKYKEISKKDKKPKTNSEKNEEIDSDESEATYESSEEAKKPSKKKIEEHVGKQIGKLSVKELELLDTVQKQNRKKNPKCKNKKRSMFRSASVPLVMIKCGSVTCPKKEPIPQEKIYKKNTIEFGVYVDRWLFEEVASIKKTKAEIKKTLLSVIQKAFVSVETYLNHKTFSSQGDINIVINGVVFLEKHGQLQSSWDDSKTLLEYLKKFQEYAAQVNSMCDADRDSYDAMVLITGRTDFVDGAGYASVYNLCKSAPVIIMKARPLGNGPALDSKGDLSPVWSRLLAHEVGHLMGARHDGDVAKQDDTGAYHQQPVPCPDGVNLMATMVSEEMTTWSECTKKMIDASFEVREKKGKNCLFT